MADIREKFNDLVGSGSPTANSPLARARATSSDRMDDQIAAENRSKEAAAKLASQAQDQGIPAWVLKYEQEKAIVNRSNNGDLYFKDGLGCTVWMTGQANQFFAEGMTVAQLCAAARAKYAPKPAFDRCDLCGYPVGPDWLDDGETCPKCRLVH